MSGCITQAFVKQAALRTILLPKVISGELRVTDAKRIVRETV